MGLITATLLLANSTASALVIDTFDNGWYNEAGSHDPGNTNIYTGLFIGNNFEYRDFQAFDLASASGNTISAATLTYYAGNGNFVSPDGTETIQISDFTSSIDDLLSGVGGVGAFADLGTGDIFGSATVTQANGSMPAVSITLSSLGLAALNTVLASSDQRFVLGGSLTSLSGLFVPEAMFSDSNAIPSSMLDLTLASVVEVPTPTTLALFGLGLAGLGWTRRRKA
jgi:hypothetical protein